MESLLIGGDFYVLKLLWSFRLNLGVYDRGRYYDDYICFLFHIVLH